MQPVQFHALPGLGVLRVAGPDAASFLQAQLTADLRRLGPGLSTLAAWCTPQGRVVALLHVTPVEDGFLAVLPRELCGPVAERLGRFVLRARVTLGDASDEFAVTGVTGRASGSFATFRDVTALRLTAGRDLLLARPERLDAVLAGTPRAADSAWELACIRLGEPEVLAATSESWVPQMLNLDLLGAVSFQKGCYPGQEIVARTQNLGRIKRRLFRYHVTGGPPPTPGAGLYSGSARSGEVVRAVLHEGVGELLAVVSLDAAGLGLADESGTVTCSPEPLPYAVPEADAAP
jgi:folate-binding protein YgfZ